MLTYYGLPLPLWQRIAALTEHVVFECDLDLCLARSPQFTMACRCCIACGYNDGYWLQDHELCGPTSSDWLNNLKHVYQFDADDRVGFWAPVGGCVLPRRLRSRQCLNFNCGFTPDPLAQTIMDLVNFPDGFYELGVPTSLVLPECRRLGDPDRIPLVDLVDRLEVCHALSPVLTTTGS